MNEQTTQASTRQTPSENLTEEQFRALLEQTDELVFIAGSDGGFIYVNARGPALLEYSRAELLQLKVADVVDESAKNFVTLLAELQPGQKIRHECQLKRKKGRAMAVELSVQALPGGLRLLSARDIRERLRVEHLQASETKVLERIACGHALPEILETLALAIEAEFDGMLCSILLLDEEGKHLMHGAAPSLPETYNRAVHGMAIGPEVGSCGTAAFTGEVIITADITKDPRWANGQELAASHRLRACWSTPIKSSKGKVLGTFALYYHEVREPGAKEKELISKACYLAGIAIERQQEVAALRQSEARLERAQKVARIGCWEWNLEKNLIWWSDELYRVFGIEHRAVAPSIEEFMELVVPEDRATLQSQIEAAMTRAGPSSVEYRICLSDGAKRDIFAEAEMDRDHHGQPKRLIGTVQDITERKRAQNQIIALNANLEKRVAERTFQIESVNKELEAFCYSISHDLRAPLRHIAGFANLLQDHAAVASNLQAGKLLASILQAARNMDQLTHDLLLFSRMGRESMKMSVLSLNQLFEEAVGSLQSDIGSRDVVWKIPALPTVQGDRAMLRQVLSNLLGNALKYTRNRPQAIIEIRCTECENETMIVIQDNGVGFNSVYADKLFNVFQRLHTADEFEGTGIGLANVRRIIARHGGRTWAEGALDVGAKVYFTLPCLQELSPRSLPPSDDSKR